MQGAPCITRIFATSKINAKLLGRKFSYVLADLGRQVVLRVDCPQRFSWVDYFKGQTPFG